LWRQQSFGSRRCRPLSPWCRRQCTRLKRRSTSARLHSAIFQKTVIFILAMRTWNVTCALFTAEVTCSIHDIWEFGSLARWLVVVILRNGPAVVQAVSRRVSARVSLCEACSGQRGLGTGYYPSSSVFSCQYYSTVDLHTASFMPLLICYKMLYKPIGGRNSETCEACCCSRLSGETSYTHEHQHASQHCEARIKFTQSCYQNVHTEQLKNG
jgi:hypothetical protein